MRNEVNDLILSSSSLSGTTVKTPQDEKIGSIKDLMIETSTGHIAYVVLEVDTGFLNLGSKYFAIPWQALSLDNHQDEVIILDVNKESLEKSPGFDKDNWPTGPQYDFINKVNAYYGVSENKNVL
ncbi:PRC-barrel domain containing protein [Echinicola strongylocentroti]|uniref:PRC-barrel domain containing protein n=1 Tax=Echinicola strongylocentroti TaxID=1795355 RepID=A0A2Z4IR90_9BACT|nr:PRC-barrel domain-containing protein [Echinicola strongylocentroti]AWW33250.1 PRC-barrel domain containing protein [Echinicola strongylocentroti]